MVFAVGILGLGACAVNEPDEADDEIVVVIGPSDKADGFSAVVDVNASDRGTWVRLDCPGDCSRVRFSIEASLAALSSLRLREFVNGTADPLLPTPLLNIATFSPRICDNTGNSQYEAWTVRASMWRSGEVIFNGIDDMRAPVANGGSVMDLADRDVVLLADWNDWGNVQTVTAAPSAFEKILDEHRNPITRISFCIKSKFPLVLSASQADPIDRTVRGVSEPMVAISDDGTAELVDTIQLGDPRLTMDVTITGRVRHPDARELAVEVRHAGHAMSPVLVQQPNGTATFELTTHAHAGFPLDAPWELHVRDRLPGQTGTLETWSVQAQPVSRPRVDEQLVLPIVPGPAGSAFTWVLTPNLFTSPMRQDGGGNYPHTTTLTLDPADLDLLDSFKIVSRRNTTRTLTRANPTATYAGVAIIQLETRPGVTRAFPTSLRMSLHAQ